MFLSLTTNLIAQPPKYRPDINALQPTEVSLLRDYLVQYISPSLINQYYQMKSAGDCYSEPNFLAFRRSLVDDFEDWLVSNNHANFVPLPAWDAGTACPIPFRQVDPDCAILGGNECSLPWNWQPYTRFLLLNPALCNYNNADFTTRMRAYQLVGGYDENVNNHMGGNMSQYGSASSLAFWIWNAYLDDVWKEYQCECTNQNPLPKQVDLFMKNSKKTFETVRDIGVEPNTDPITWESPDIWIRNDNLGFSTDQMQNPNYSAIQPRKAYVRVRNRGCVNSTGTEVLKLYWAKAGTYHNWPGPWDGLPVNTPAQVIGGLVGVKTIPVINKGGQAIIDFDWLIPNPSQFGNPEFDSNGDNIPDAWHYCLLARIEAPNDPDGVVLNGNNMTSILQNSNNFVLRNFHVINIIYTINGGKKLNDGSIALGNVSNQNESYDLRFEAPTTFNHPNPITKEAEVIITLSEMAWDKWNVGGRQSSDVEIYSEDERKIRITSDNATLQNMNYDSNQVSVINLAFNFLTDEVSEETNYMYRVHQLSNINQSLIGGHTFKIERGERSLFNANAGYDQSIQDNQSTTLSAVDIGEPAEYKWYDGSGLLIHKGQTKNVSPLITTTYRLEVIANDDGYKDYDDVTIQVKDKYIISISPNPTSGSATVNYKIKNIQNAQILVSQQPNGNSQTYELNLTTNSTLIDLSGFIQGVYNVTLICDGKNEDTKILLIQ